MDISTHSSTAMVTPVATIRMVGGIGDVACFPSIDFDENFLRIMQSRPWKGELTITVLGKLLTSADLRDELYMLWNPEGQMDLYDVGPGLVIVKFSEAEDREMVITQGPWKVQGDYYLAIAPWSRELVNSNMGLTRTLAWVKFPGMSIDYYDDAALKLIAGLLGKLVRVDINVKGAGRKFARVSVEVDLSKSLIRKVMIDGNLQLVSCEGLQPASLEQDLPYLERKSLFVFGKYLGDWFEGCGTADLHIQEDNVV